MLKNTQKKYKISRRLGVALWGSSKDAYNKRNYPPGMHGSSIRKKNTEYGEQLLEKQKVKKYYGNIKEKQFKKIYREAYKKRGDTGEAFIGLLESRLDAFIFRVKFAPTIYSARQYVTHGHITVNKKNVNIPSYNLKPDDIVEVKEKSKKMTIFNNKIKQVKDIVYIMIDRKNLKAKYLKIPLIKEIPYSFSISVKLIIEFYSR